jgi:hypothetical protein
MVTPTWFSPNRKRYGGEMSFYVPAERNNGKPLLGGEFFFNDAKEMYVESPANKGIVGWCASFIIDQCDSLNLGRRLLVTLMTTMHFWIMKRMSSEIIDQYDDNKSLATPMD